jgi:hypothetical protein
LSNYSALADLIIANRDEYCARHGYKHLVKVGPHWKADAYYAFQRLAYIRELLDTESAPDFVWGLNVQSVLTNMTKPVTDYIADPTKHFWATPDRNVSLNMGSFIVRNSDWALHHQQGAGLPGRLLV